MPWTYDSIQQLFQRLDKIIRLLKPPPPKIEIVKKRRGRPRKHAGRIS